MKRIKRTLKLYRSNDDSMIGGVCGGISERYDIDSTWVRMLFILFFFAGGCALLVYLIMWLIVPLNPA
jgi:phage shock protein C